MSIISALATGNRVKRLFLVCDNATRAEILVILISVYLVKVISSDLSFLFIIIDLSIIRYIEEKSNSFIIISLY